MTDHTQVESLLGPMALGAVDDEERALVEQHVASCAACRDELAALTATVSRLGALEERDLLPVPDLGDSVLAALGREHAAERRRSRLLVAAAAVVVLAAGASSAYALVRDESPDAPPVVAIGVQADPGITATAGYVAHTWGLEIKLDAAGLAQGGAYDVDVIDRRGRASTAGAFVGTGARTIHCSLNSGVLAPDVASFVVRDARGAEVVRGTL